MRLWRAALLALMAVPLTAPIAGAQTVWAPLEATPQRTQGPQVTSGTVASLRTLDKVSGALTDLSLRLGESATFGHLTVTLTACRFPTDNPAADAFAFVEIVDSADRERLFLGWMVASSPALNALDHPRYDLWVLGCE